MSEKKGLLSLSISAKGSIPITSPCPNNCAPEWQVRGDPNEHHQIVKWLDLKIRRCVLSPDNLSEPQNVSTASSPRLRFMKVVDRVYVTIRVNRDVEITTDRLLIALRTVTLGLCDRVHSQRKCTFFFVAHSCQQTSDGTLFVPFPPRQLRIVKRA